MGRRRRKRGKEKGWGEREGKVVGWGEEGVRAGHVGICVCMSRSVTS